MARADPRRLQGPRRLGHGPAVERRLDRRRGAEHPRGPAARRRADRTRSLHYFLEASRYAFADRNKYLGDPDYVDVPLRLPAVRPLRGRAARADHRAGGRTRRCRAATAGRPAPSGVAQEGPSTTHLTVADERGYVVSYTFTIESTGGNGIVVPGYGFLLNNELTDFDYSSTSRPEPRRGRQAAAQLDGADDHHPARPAGAGRRLAGRLDDHHHRAAGAGRAARARQDAAGRRSPSPRASQRNGATSIAEPAFMQTEAPALTGGPRPRVRHAAERDRRGDRDRVPRPRPLPRRRRADPARRRQRGVVGSATLKV